MNIFNLEMKMNRRSVITWSIAVTAVLFLFATVFSTIADDMAALNEVMANYPPELLAAFGWDQMDLSTVLGFFAFSFSFIQIMIALQAANYGFSLVSVEERELTADFLLSKPVGRVQILTSKLLAALASLLITNAVLWAASFAAVILFAEGRSFDAGALALVLLSAFFVQLFFLTVGVAVSLLLRKVPSVISLSMGTVFGMYILAAFGGSMGEDKFDYLTPFKHFEATQIVTDGGYDPAKALVSAAVIVISLTASYMLYKRRDIPTV